MLSSGKLPKREGRGPISPAMHGEGRTKSNARIGGHRRTPFARRFSKKERKGSSRSQRLSAKPFNKLDYERRQGANPRRGSGLRGGARGYHEKYGGALEVDAERVVNEEWSSSFPPKDEDP